MRRNDDENKPGRRSGRGSREVKIVERFQSVRDDVVRELQEGFERALSEVKELAWRHVTETLQRIQQRLEKRVH